MGGDNPILLSGWPLLIALRKGFIVTHNGELL